MMSADPPGTIKERMDEGSESDTSEIELMEDEEDALLLNDEEQLSSLIEVVRKEKHSNKSKRSSCGTTLLYFVLSFALAFGAAYYFLIYRKYPHYSCPAYFEEDEKSASSYLLAKGRVENETQFLLSYRKKGHMEHWGTSYEKYKQKMYDWKVNGFGELKNGDSIYESASGLGLNLVMTLEILEEKYNTSNLVVYGNDYVASSVKTSNNLMDNGILPAGGRKGRICQGDSGNLSWVPSSAFDLVYTGYITPLQDPLEFHEDEESLWKRYEKICKASSNYDKARKKQMQQLQEDWYAQWVGEMIRIAKPGAPVILEQVSQSVCDDIHDWGGVDKKFWFVAPEIYGWPVNTSQTRFTPASPDDKKDGRYHVFMRKSLDDKKK